MVHYNYYVTLMQTPGCLRNYYTIAKSRTQSNIVPTCRLIYQISPEGKQQRDCGEGQETADTYKACQPFLPLNSTVLFGHFAAAKCPHRTPQKTGVKLGGYPHANYRIRITNEYRSHPVSQRYSPVFFPWFL